MSLEKTANDVLKETSRTFYLSIVRLPPRIKEAVMSSYLCLRAIDEIEDHQHLEKCAKIDLLHGINTWFHARLCRQPHRVLPLLKPYRDDLPEVTNRLDEWAALAAVDIAPRIWQSTADMAQRMAYWVDRDWRITNRRDLDRYTFCVAGAVGVLLTDLWNWYDGTTSRRRDGISYGRGLQAVNILRNRTEDLDRGVDFFPDGWTETDFHSYARSSLLRGDSYINSFPPGPAREFCQLPQVLAYATLEALDRGESKVSRETVLEFIGQSTSETPVH